MNLGYPLYFRLLEATNNHRNRFGRLLLQVREREHKRNIKKQLKSEEKKPQNLCYPRTRKETTEKKTSTPKTRKKNAAPQEQRKEETSMERKKKLNSKDKKEN